MTPAEVIRRLFPSAKWGNPEWQAVKDVLAEEGMVVVAAADAKTVAALAAHYLQFMEPEPGELEAIRRVLAAALPERNADV